VVFFQIGIFFGFSLVVLMIKKEAAKLRWADGGAQRPVLRLNEPKRLVRAAHVRAMLTVCVTYKKCT
jgi:hypothetical protein